MRKANSEPTGFKVYFGARNASIESLPNRSILIAPAGDKWNDFGRRTRARVHVKFAKDVLHTFKTMIGFAQQSDEQAELAGAAQIDRILDEVGSGGVTPALAEHQFFTMLTSMEEYRSIRRMLAEDTVAVLLAVNDVVATNAHAPKSAWIGQALTTNTFALSFLRNAEAFYAFKNANTILEGREYESILEASRSLRVRFKLGEDRSYDLTFDFDHKGVLPKRMAVIIGKNGVGKSQVLRRIARAALTDFEGLTDRDGGRPQFNRILAFAPTVEAGSIFPVSGRSSRAWYKRFFLNRVSADLRGVGGLTDLMVQIARSESAIGGQFRWDIMIGALSAIDRFDQIAVALNDGQIIKIVELLAANEARLLERFATIDLRREPFRYVDGRIHTLSSGERSFLNFATQACLYIENGSLLLLDEPETHLHPNFISQFSSLLERILAATGSQAVIATHSAYIVREVFREQVTILRADAELGVVSQVPTLRTFGADVGAISYFVFGEDEHSQLASDAETRLLESGLSWDELYERFKDELSLEFLNDLHLSVESR